MASSDRKLVRLDYCDIGARFVKDTHYFTRLLRTRYDVDISCQPDLIIHSHDGYQHRLYPCPRVLYTAETDQPDYRETDFSISQLDWGDPRNLRLPVYSLWTDPEPLAKQPGEAEAALAAKSRFCCFFTSYVGEKIKRRLGFFEQLSRYKQVDSAGGAMNNIGQRIPFELSAKLNFLRPYKFYMAFENESRVGYTTEKIVEAMLARCVPIYWGNPAIVEEFNPKSFINVHDFPNDEAVIEHIRQVDQDDDLYREYLRQPFFHDNKPNIYFSKERLLNFFEQAIAAPHGRRHRGALLGRWTLAKVNKRHDPHADYKINWRPGRTV